MSSKLQKRGLILNNQLAVAIAAFMCIGSMNNAYGSNLIEEVIVTAQKRAESLQDVPIAITVFSSDNLEKSRLDNLGDVATRTPNFAIGEQSPIAPELTIRGIGSADREAGSDRSVVVFVDEVYIGRAGASTFDLFDLERVEVLRGPQGTLYGKNVVGGVVNLITAEPHSDTEGKFQLTLGNYGLKEAKALYNTALSDNIYGRVSVSVKDRSDGYFDNIQLNQADVESEESQSIRGRIKFDSWENFNVLITGEYSHAEQNGLVSKITQGEVSDSDFAAALAPFNFTPSPDLFQVSNNRLGEVERDSWSLYSRIEWITSAGMLTYIPAYRNNQIDLSRDLAGIGLSNEGTPQQKGFDSSILTDEKYSALSHELRFSSFEEENAFNWTVGLYYLSEDTNRDLTRVRQANNSFSRPNFDQHAESTSYGVFGEMYFQLTDAVNVTLGTRYTTDKKHFDVDVTNTLSAQEQIDIEAMLGRPTTLSPASEEFSASGDEKWSESTPKLTFNWAVNENNLLYATVSKGFKGGGFNGLAATKQIAELAFAPETAINYEVGTKSQFFDNTFQLNASIFKIDFEELQLRDSRLLIPGDESSRIVNIVNAAEAEITGIELEFILNPVENLSLSGNYSKLVTEIVSVAEGSTIDKGSELPRAPEESWVLAAEYTIPLEKGNLAVGSDYRYIGQQFFDINELMAGNEPGYGILDARIAYFSSSEVWELIAWAKNLGDEEYRTHVQSIRAGRAGVSRIGSPRTFGLTYTRHF